MTELSALVRFVHLAAAVLLVGSFSFVQLIGLPAIKKSHIGSNDLVFLCLRFHRHIAIWGLFAVSLSALFGLGIQIVNVSDPSARTILASLAVVSVLTDTQYGKVWLARLFLTIVLAALQFELETGRVKSDSVIYITGGMIVSACLLASIALSGHAAAGEGLALVAHVSVDAVHLLASGLWLGGLVPLFVFLHNTSRANDAKVLTIARETTLRYSRLGLICVTVLIATGAYNAWILVGGFPALFGTPYGRLLLIKLGFLLPLLSVAAINLRHLKPSIIATSPDQPERITALRKKLRRNMIIEACFGVMILFIVGGMGVTPPARHVQPDWPFSFRWDWSSLAKAPKTRAEVDRGIAWSVVGGVAIIAALARRRRRLVISAIAIGALGYAGYIVHNAVLIDAYPATYQRPGVTYNAISVANGKLLYQESGCVTCHGVNGYGDGPAGQDLDPKPVDLTAPHANTHTAGDLFWWLSHGVKSTSAMPGYNQSLSEEERWDLINFMRALSSGERARNLAPVIESDPWLVAPDFAYGTNAGDTKTLRDHRADKIVLLVLLNVQATEERLKQLAAALPQLESLGVEIIVVPETLRQKTVASTAANESERSTRAKSPFHPPLAKGERGGFDRSETVDAIDPLNVADKLPGLIVNEGIREITETYSLFSRSFAEEKPFDVTPHMEFLIDKQGYIRARWLAAESDAWRKIDVLLKQVELLRNEKPRAPAPDEHVH